MNGSKLRTKDLRLYHCQDGKSRMKEVSTPIFSLLTIWMQDLLLICTIKRAQTQLQNYIGDQAVSSGITMVILHISTTTMDNLFLHWRDEDEKLQSNSR